MSRAPGGPRGTSLAARSGEPHALAPGAVLASYSFDDDVATGPDTFAVWQGARHSRSGRGHVRLTDDKFSFVGSPFGDGSNVVYYVDDVVISSDEHVTRLPFQAPGRRKLFIDSFGEYQRRLRERPRCLPATSPEDFGLEPDDLAALAFAALGRIEEADARLALASALRHDARYAVASAYVGPARHDLDRALEWLRDPAARALDPGRARAGRRAARDRAVLLRPGLEEHLRRRPRLRAPDG